MRCKVFRCLVIVLVLSLLPLFLLACESGGGSTSSGGGDSGDESYITGFVQLQLQSDHSGATVYLEEGSVYYSLTTSTGYYKINNVPDGTYTPVAKKAGYKDKVWDGASLTFPAKHTGVDFSLQPG